MIGLLRVKREGPIIILGLDRAALTARFGLPRLAVSAAAGAFLFPLNSCVHPNACLARSQVNNAC